jgi:regulator of sigma E protease
LDLTTLIPQFGGALWTVIFFVVALSVIIAVHEYGHFIVGKKTGIFPEVFSLGFGPVLWSRVDRDGTKWQLAAIPFGGYVKFRGDANASGGVDAEAIEGLGAGGHGGCRSDFQLRPLHSDLCRGPDVPGRGHGTADRG